MGWDRHWGFAPYVRVADRKKKAAQKIAGLKKKGQNVQPIFLEGKTIVNTFWGKAWCIHLESFSDFDNRLPRGRSYVRNGLVIDLKVNKGNIKALVSGSSVYKVNVTVKPVDTKKWKLLIKECSGKIDSLVELLLGKFSKNVMEIITHPEKGLFPQPKEIEFDCSCPDSADMCKHIAAVLYGVGARFDKQPEDLFLLRKVDHVELIAKVNTKSLTKQSGLQEADILKDSDLSALFGIEIESENLKSHPTSKKIKPKKSKVISPKPKKVIKKALSKSK
jgi:uncharacterized Zn finger protein